MFLPKKIMSLYGGTYILKFPKDKEEYDNYVSGVSNLVTGKEVVIKEGLPYTCLDELEVKFASLRPDLSILDLKAPEIVEYFRTAILEPSVEAKLTPKIAREFLFKDQDEDKILINLYKWGYLTEKDNSSTEELIASNGGLMTLLKDIPFDTLKETLKEMGYIGIRKADNK